MMNANLVAMERGAVRKYRDGAPVCALVRAGWRGIGGVLVLGECW